MSDTSPDVETVLELSDGSPETVMAAMAEQGWGDGLPVVPPTPDRVEAMVAATGRAPNDLVAVVPPRHGRATVEVIAANAVMAGCAPEHFPVVLAAIAAMTAPEFNLTAVQATTHPVAPLVVVHGPICERIGMNGGAGVFGPGFRANASIGRAVRLMLLDVGGGTPGTGDRSTQGNPAKYSYCIAENTRSSPWGSFASTRGFTPDQDAVTVIPAEAPHNINDHVAGGSADHVLSMTAAAMANPAANNPYSLIATEVWVVFGPEHAATVYAGGFERDDVQRYLYEHARIPLGALRRGGMFGMQDWPPWMRSDAPDDTRYPVALEPDRIGVLVAGGPGKHSSWLPTNGASRSVTVEVPPCPS